MSDHEVEYNGILLTCDGDDELSVRSFAGLGGPEVSQSYTAWSSTDGSSPEGPARLPTRLMVFEALIECSTPELAQLKLRQLVTAWGPVRSGLATVRVRIGGQDYEVDGRPGKVDANVQDLHVSVVRARLTWIGLDPRLYAGTADSTTHLGLGTSGGFVVPITFPYSASGLVVGDPADVSVTNEGGFETHWTVSIVGPVSAPRISLAETGETVDLTGDVPAGSTLVLSSRERTIRLDGSPRPQWLTLASKWWLLPAGTSTIRFRAVSGSGTATFNWRHAWL